MLSEIIEDTIKLQGATRICRFNWIEGQGLVGLYQLQTSRVSIIAPCGQGSLKGKFVTLPITSANGPWAVSSSRPVQPFN